MIECALQNGNGGDGIRILGVQGGYFARNLIENLLKRSSGDHCDAMQFTHDDFSVRNTLECVDHLHWGTSGNNRFEGFQGTNTIPNGPNGAVNVRRLKTIGGEVSGIAIFGCEGSEVEDCELYDINYGVVGAQPPKIIIRNSHNVKLIGANKAAGGFGTQTDSGGATTTIVQNDGVSTTGMLLADAAERGAIVAAWKSGVGQHVPYI